VRHPIYPVPDPRLPFLGVHFTRTIEGHVHAGPNAVLALKREGYARTDVSTRDVAEMFGFVGFWRMAGRYWGTGLAELARSLSKAAFVRALQRLVPNLRAEDVVPGGSGVRAQAVDRAGRLIGDFKIVEGNARCTSSTRLRPRRRRASVSAVTSPVARGSCSRAD